MATSQRRGGIEVEGLAETLRGLKRLDGRWRAEAVDTFRDAAKDVQSTAQGRIGAGGYRLKRARGMIGRSATGTGAGVKLRASRHPYALQAEFGEKVAHVHGHPTDQHRLRRRTAGPYRPPTSADMMANTGGYMIQPAIRARLPHWEREVARRLAALVKRAMRTGGR